MIDLYGNRSDEVFTYREVSWDDWGEGNDLTNITDGSVELSALSDLKATCSFSFEGGKAPDVNKLVRIYYSFEDDHGETATFPIGTFFPKYSSVTNIADYVGNECVGLKVSGTCDGSSVLKVLYEDSPGYPYTVPAGTNCVEHAIWIITADEDGLVHRLRTNNPDPSAYTLAQDHTFEPTDSWATIANWLLTTAGYRSMYPDAYGVVQITKNRAPGVQMAFSNGDDSIMYPEVEVENGWQDTPNVCRAYFENDDVSLFVAAKNVSGTEFSLDACGGREKTIHESVAELQGSTVSAMVDNLIDIAVDTLVDNSMIIEHVTFSHPYIPLMPNNGVRIEYADMAWEGTVTNMAIELSPSTKTTTKIRKFLEREIVIGLEVYPDD